MKGAINVSVEGSMRTIIEDLERIHRQHVPDATVRALNRTAKHVQSLVKKELSAQLKIPQKVAATRLPIARASRRRLDAVLYLKHRPMNPWIAGARKAKAVAAEAGGWALPPGHRSRPQSVIKPRSAAGKLRRVQWTRQGGYDRGGNTFPKGIVLQRKGKERYPTESVGMPLTGVHGMILRHLQASEPFFAKAFAHELQYRIDRSKGK